jgi:hypothetical protein
MMRAVSHHESWAERERLKREHPEYWAAVHAAVNAEDPEGLLSMGAPTDEYDPEVADLVRMVLESSVTADRVLDLWRQWFGATGLDRNPVALRRLAAALARLQPGC